MYTIQYTDRLPSILQILNGTKTYLRPLSSAVVSQSQTLAAQNTKPVSLLPQVRSFQTSTTSRDIDSAAKFIGAGAATVGVAGSGTLSIVGWVKWEKEFCKVASKVNQLSFSRLSLFRYIIINVCH